jgi:hypothetical protein
VFVGIAARDDVDRYLGGVGHSQVDDFGDGSARYTQVAGRAPSSDPAVESFWLAQSEGAGSQTVEWDVEGGTTRPWS